MHEATTRWPGCTPSKFQVMVSMEEEAPTSSSFNPADWPPVMLLLTSAASSQVKLAVPCPDQVHLSLAVSLLMSRTVRLRLDPETSAVPGRVRLNKSEKVGIVGIVQSGNWN